MAVNDPLGDMLTRIRNGMRAHKATVRSPASRFRASVLDVLKREGYIRGFERREGEPGHAEFEIELKYHEGEPAIREIHRVSTPGRRVYSSVEKLTRVYNGLGVAIVSTPRGVMTDADARAQRVGGEILCTVF
ncbi:MAG: 30S ribosomal protein S8 [Alphaproteobacteria bacterium]|nr:30S ribosomal protein S8 [Alphaproteobacteria bacterium]